MAKTRMLQPVSPIHPGEMLLEEFLRPAGKSQATFDLGAALQKRRAT
jgi:plasmid maintenance system antidote protein VapI